MTTFVGPPSIETFYTDRLIAERFQADDFGELCRMHREPKIMATLGGVRSDAETRRFLRERLDHWDKYGWGYWMFRHKVKRHYLRCEILAMMNALFG